MAETPTILSVILFLGCYLRVRQRWFMPGYSGFGYVTWVVQSTIDGTAIAPNQYRPLMPWIDKAAARMLGVPLPTGILVSDLLLLLLVVVLLRHLAVRSGHAHLTLAGAATWTYWVAKLDQWHPEIMVLTAIVLAAVILLLDPAPHCGALVGLGLLACATRTDYAAGLGVTILVLALLRRRKALALAGFCVIAASGLATVALVHIYPQARYDVDLVQLPYNLSWGTMAFALAFYGPLVILPFVALAAGRLRPVQMAGPLWFVLQFAFVFIVGRTDESRIFMPLAPALGVAAAAAWVSLRALLPSPAADVRALLPEESSLEPSDSGRLESRRLVAAGTAGRPSP